MTPNELALLAAVLMVADHIGDTTTVVVLHDKNFRYYLEQAKLLHDMAQKRLTE